MHKISFLLLSAAMLLITSCSNKNNKGTSQPKAKADIAIDDSLKNSLAGFIGKSQWTKNSGIYIYDITADKPLYGLNEKRMMPPASCLKLLSGIAALKTMGVDYGYLTALYMNGTIKGDTLKGKAFFRTSLDPKLQPQDLDMFFKALRKKGVRRIDGKLVVDFACKEFPDPEEHWYPWDISQKQYGLFYQRPNRIMRDIAAAAHRQGILVKNSDVVEGQTEKGARKVFIFKHDIKAALRRSWKNSSNANSTGLLYTMGGTLKDPAGFRAGGITVMERFIREELKDTCSQYVLHDGCGLCPLNRVNAMFLVSLIRYAYSDPQLKSCLRTYLPLAGVDGTLRRQMYKPATRGKVYAKTGTLSHPYGISSLTGYTTGRNGHILAFSIMNMEMSVLDARPFQNKICELLVK